MMFADVPEMNSGTWVAVGLSLVTMAGGVVSLAINAIKERNMTRDKLQYDQQLTELRQSNKDCADDHKAAKEEVTVLKDEVGELKVKLDKCQEHHATTDVVHGKMWAEIQKLKEAK